MKLPSIQINMGDISNYDEALQKEWLITNGLGGYASSTIYNLNTRKYHGLLVAALRPPGDRTVCLTKLDEEIFLDKVYQLGANQFHNMVFPQGQLYLRQISLSPFPTSTYQVPNCTVSKTIFMPYKKNVVAAFYELRNLADQIAEFRVFPLMTCRHFHEVIDLSRKPLSFEQINDNQKVELAFKAPSATVIARSTPGEFIEKPEWIHNIHYREENFRGEESIDNYFQPGYFKLALDSKSETKFAVVTAADENGKEALGVLNSVGTSIQDLEQAYYKDLELRSHLLDDFFGSHEKIISNEWLNSILLAADSFVVQDLLEKRSIIAGYFWFESWGRDTFISLPGLLLITGRFNDAKYVLLNFSHYCRNGLIPNIILDKSGQPIYNTVDGTLWFINAVFEYLKYTGDFDFVFGELWGTLKLIVENHEHGTDFEIRLDSDGLLSHGPRLTWMDAYFEGVAITPREGKAVEIQALWYNALRIMQILAFRFKEAKLSEKYALMASKTKKSFNEKFWNEANSCLVDVVEKTHSDISLRPNQIIAVSLDFTMLNDDKSKKIVDLVIREFLTPHGLRTLSKSDPRYQSVYRGSLKNRDQAYHNGAVWPWLLGPFISAFLRVPDNSSMNVEYYLKDLIQGLFEKQIYNGGLGTVNEIFDGDPPHTPRGCISQAWSVAEPLRALVEDVLQFTPKYEKAILSKANEIETL